MVITKRGSRGRHQMLGGLLSASDRAYNRISGARQHRRTQPHLGSPVRTHPNIASHNLSVIYPGLLQENNQQ